MLVYFKNPIEKIPLLFFISETHRRTWSSYPVLVTSESSEKFGGIFWHRLYHKVKNTNLINWSEIILILSVYLSYFLYPGTNIQHSKFKGLLCLAQSLSSWSLASQQKQTDQRAYWGKGAQHREARKRENGGARGNNTPFLVRPRHSFPVSATSTQTLSPQSSLIYRTN